MTPISEFLERYDAQKPQFDSGDYVHGGDDALTRAGERFAPFLERVAERGGIETGELAAAMWARIQAPTQIIVERTIVNGNMVLEIARALRDIAADGFLAGVLWEQERQMPRIDT